MNFFDIVVILGVTALLFVASDKAARELFNNYVKRFSKVGFVKYHNLWFDAQVSAWLDNQKLKSDWLVRWANELRLQKHIFIELRRKSS